MRGARQTGSRGEEAVAEYLTARGHVILDRNWRYGPLELDLVTLDSLGVHFVEVKTCSCNDDSGQPWERVGILKRKRMAQAAAGYLHKRSGQIGDSEAFFDVASVTRKNGKYIVDYFPNAFIPIG